MPDWETRRNIQPLHRGVVALTRASSPLKQLFAEKGSQDSLFLGAIGRVGCDTTHEFCTPMAVRRRLGPRSRTPPGGRDSLASADSGVMRVASLLLVKGLLSPRVSLSCTFSLQDCLVFCAIYPYSLCLNSSQPHTSCRRDTFSIHQMA